MAIRRKGSRRIIVERVAYLWRFPRRATQDQEDGWPGIMVTVQRAESKGAVLVVTFPQRFHLSGPIGEPSKPVLPSEIARCIRVALAAGWHAARPGKQFVLRVEHDAEQIAAADRPRE